MRSWNRFILYYTFCYLVVGLTYHHLSQNFISPSTVRDVTSLRIDFLSALSQLGFISPSSKPSSPELNANASNTNLVKAVVLGGLWPRIARVHLPRSAIKFDRVQAGTVQRENTAREYKLYDLRDGRVFLHPASIMFGASAWRSPFVAYFQKQMTSKVFLRDATEVRAWLRPYFVSRCMPLTRLCSIGPHLRTPALRWPRLDQSHRRRRYSRRERLFHQAEGMAPHRRACQPPPVCLSHNSFKLSMRPRLTYSIAMGIGLVVFQTSSGCAAAAVYRGWYRA